ncbi:MAG TPA: hypothetical protein VE980_23205 [Pyrinomonadaceae bacterium]|nr:hypothetical protein [Pyrinomonadaceae bacterium]
MGEFSKWLLHEDQKEFFDYVFAIVLNICFLVLATLVLWPLGRATFALSLAKGYWVFWTVVIITSTVLVLIQRFFRMDLYSHFDAYVISGLVLSGFLQLGWSAFVALAVRNSITNMSVWMAVVMITVGVISCYVAAVIVGAFYVGGLYRLMSLFLGILSFILFIIWPAAGAAIYGWFFDLVRRFSPLGIFR